MFSFSTTKVAFLSKFRTGLLTFYFIVLFIKCISNNYTIIKMENFLLFHIFYIFDYLLFKNIFGKLSFF